ARDSEPGARRRPGNRLPAPSPARRLPAQGDLHGSADYRPGPSRVRGRQRFADRPGPARKVTETEIRGVSPWLTPRIDKPSRAEARPPRLPGAARSGSPRPPREAGGPARESRAA